MRSVADALRAELVERVRAMTVEERLALTARLADDDVRLFASARGISEDDARRRLACQRRSGRRRSAAIDALPDE